MNKIYAPAVALATASILFSGCSKTEGNRGDDASQIHHITLTAGTAENDSDNLSDGNSDKANGIETKAIFAADVTSNTPFYWQKTDKVGVFASGAEGIYPLTVKERATDYKNATFEGNIKGTLGEYAVYPYNENHKISGNTLTYHLPSVYSDVNSFVAQDYLTSSSLSNIDSYAGNANPALLAKISNDGNSAEFKHLGGVLCISIANCKASLVEFTITADRQICGDFSVDLTADNPQIKTTDQATTSTEVAGNDNTVKIYGRISVLNNPGIFYIPMPVGDYNLRITIGYPNGVPSYYEKAFYHVSAEKSLSINRTNIRRASLDAKTLYKNGYMLVDGYKFVDLGLPSGNLWATTNVGAALPADYGNYYAYADAAAAAQGCTKKCKIPSPKEFTELSDNTDKEYTSGEKNSSDNWTPGIYFKSKSENNSNYIFVPFCGYYEDNRAQQEKYGFYSWTDSKSDDQYWQIVYVGLLNNKPYFDIQRLSSTYLFTIRPVITQDSI